MLLSCESSNKMDNKLLYRLTKPLTHILIEKNSKFIVLAQPVSGFKESCALLEQTRMRYKDASHNCWAFTSSFTNYDRASDDGEPMNSAGKPILQAIKGANIADVMVIVTRYFGGTELGVGGLVRAYSSATKECLAQSSIENKGLEIIVPTSQVQITGSMDEIGVIYQILNAEKCTRLSENFIEEKGLSKMCIIIEIPSSRLAILTQLLTNRCKGRASVMTLVEKES